MAVVYRHIRLDKQEPFYIGIGKEVKRAYQSKKSSRNKIWKDITSKSEYEVEILFDDLTWEQACEKEREFIKLYGRIDLGTGTLANLTDGGEGTIGYITSEETKQFLSELGKKKVFTDEYRKKLSESAKGRKKPHVGERNKLTKSKTFLCTICGTTDLNNFYTQHAWPRKSKCKQCVYSTNKHKKDI